MSIQVQTREITYLQAVGEAQREEMARDDRVILIGEDIRGNLLRGSGKLFQEFGPDRVLDAPISEAGFVGAAVGAAMTGLRPIVDLSIANFMYVAMDQLVSQAAKVRYMFGGQADIPVTYRVSMFWAGNNAAHHSDRPYSMFMNVPGLKIIAPSTPADAKGLLKAAIRENDPVISFEDISLWGTKGAVADGEHFIPLGVADVKREGDDVTLVAIGPGVRPALAAAEELDASGISVEVVDPRSLVPIDWDTIVNSVGKTRKLVVVDFAHRTCSAASEIAATVSEHLFSVLDAPVRRVTTPDMQVPFSPALTDALFPTQARIVDAVRHTVEWAP